MNEEKVFDCYSKQKKLANTRALDIALNRIQ